MNSNDIAGHFRPRPGYWFVPHMFGIGATPVTWQGWALTIGFVGLFLLDMRFVPETIARIGMGAALAIGFTVLCARKTDGGLRWHWGTGK